MREWLNFNRAEKVVLAICAVVLLAIAVVWGGAKLNAPGPVTFHDAPAPLRVRVTGAVRQPGYYMVQPGDRVQDALRMAGGATETAAMEGINLASPVGDGDTIEVPTAVK